MTESGEPPAQLGNIGFSAIQRLAILEKRLPLGRKNGPRMRDPIVPLMRQARQEELLDAIARNAASGNGRSQELEFGGTLSPFSTAALKARVRCARLLTSVAGRQG